jgi:hypothetical protein
MLLVLALVAGLFWSLAPARADAGTCNIDGITRLCGTGYDAAKFTYDGRAHEFVIATDHSVWHRWTGCSGCGFGSWQPVPNYSWAGPGDPLWNGRAADWRIWDSGRSLTIKVKNGDNFWCQTYNSPDARGRWNGWAICVANGPRF